MRGAHKAGLVQRRGKVLALLQHAVEKLVETRLVGGHHLRVVGGQLGQEEKAKQTALPIHTEGDAGCVGLCLQALHELAGFQVQLSVKAGDADQLQRFEAAGGGNRVARERAGLVHPAEGREFFHDLAPSAKGRQRHPAANDLAHDSDVGLKALDLLRVQALGAAQGDAKAGHHLVVNHQRPVLLRQLADAAGELHAGAHKVHVAGNGLHDHAGDFAAHLGKGFFQLGHIVVFKDDGVFHHIGGHPSGRRAAKGGQPRAGLDQQRIGMAVVAAIEFDDLVAPGKAPGQAQGAHARLGARADQAHHVHAGHQGEDFFGQGHFTLGRGTVAEAFIDSGVHGGHHLRVAVAQNHRPPATDVVGKALAVFVPKIRPLGAFNKARHAANGVESAHGRIHAARNDALGAGEQVLVQVSGMGHSHARKGPTRGKKSTI